MSEKTLNIEEILKPTPIDETKEILPDVIRATAAACRQFADSLDEHPQIGDSRGESMIESIKRVNDGTPHAAFKVTVYDDMGWDDCFGEDGWKQIEEGCCRSKIVHCPELIDMIVHMGGEWSLFGYICSEIFNQD